MPSLNTLQKRLQDLESQIEAVKQEGEFLTGVRLERSPAGGTASQEAKETSKYARLRSGRGRLLPNGKKSMYIPVKEIARYDAACKRGDRIQKLERELNQVKTLIARLELSQYSKLKGGKPTRSSQNHALPFVSSSTSSPIEVTIPPPELAPAAILVLYRQHSNTPVHAVAAEIWKGDQKLAEVKAIHCMGMKGDRVSAYIKEMLVSLNQLFGVSRFEDVIKEVPVENCPLENCPLKV